MLALVLKCHSRTEVWNGSLDAAGLGTPLQRAGPVGSEQPSASLVGNRVCRTSRPDVARLILKRFGVHLAERDVDALLRRARRCRANGGCRPQNT